MNMFEINKKLENENLNPDEKQIKKKKKDSHKVSIAEWGNREQSHSTPRQINRNYLNKREKDLKHGLTLRLPLGQ